MVGEIYYFKLNFLAQYKNIINDKKDSEKEKSLINFTNFY